MNASAHTHRTPVPLTPRISARRRENVGLGIPNPIDDWVCGGKPGAPTASALEETTPLDATDGSMSSPTFSHPLVAARGRDVVHAVHSVHSSATFGAGGRVRPSSRRLTPPAIICRRSTAPGPHATPPAHPLQSPCGVRRPASCSFHTGASRTTAPGGGRQVALAGQSEQQAASSPHPSAERCTGHRTAAHHTERKGRLPRPFLSAGFPAAIPSRNRPPTAASATRGPGQRGRLRHFLPEETRLVSHPSRYDGWQHVQPHVF